MSTSNLVVSFPSLLQRFFCDRLISQQNASARTVAAYRDTFRVLLRYLQKETGRLPSELSLAHFDASTVIRFLSYLENRRGNCVRTRNARLAAIRSFLNYAAGQDPICLPIVQRVRAIPMKRYDRPALGFLSRVEVNAILDAPSAKTWSGRRDRALFTVLYNTGARVSEITSLERQNLSIESSMSVRLHGKGRKERVVPLWKATGRLLRQWTKEIRAGAQAPVFPSTSGAALSRSGVEYRLRRALLAASARCPSLVGRKVTPHTFRHTTAMHLLQSGVDLSVIALWLGHESLSTTHMYLEADLAMKQKALAALSEPNTVTPRYRPPDKLLSFLESL